MSEPKHKEFTSLKSNAVENNIVKANAIKTNESDSIQVITLGCRLNTYESEVMKDHAQSNDLKNTIIVNTCAVTNEAERSSRQSIRRAKKANPNAKIIATGCSAQINPDMYKNMPEVDLVLGNQEKMLKDSFTFDHEFKSHTEATVRVNDIMDIKETAHHLISGFEDRVRAFIQIQNGCDHRCTFCTIPFGRGNNRSVPMGEILQQIKKLVENGCKEVVFTGVDITGYGSNLPGKPTLGQMTKRILAQVPELNRLRLSSVDPVEIDDDLFDLIRHEPRLMPHMHISLQAGDDMTLKRMKRRHLRQDAIDFCNKVRNLRPDVVFGADIIAGFPTETDNMFENTLNLVRDCNLTYLHIFPYSARKGTPASKMPQVLMATRKYRAAQLRKAGKEQEIAFYASRVGTKASILIEVDGRGHTEHFAPVRLEGISDSVLNATIIEAEIIGYDQNGLIAKHIPILFQNVDLET